MRAAERPIPEPVMTRSMFRTRYLVVFPAVKIAC
jgi:hypothetical protein